MPKIRMLKSAIGCEEGIHCKEYVEGECHDVSDALAKDFLSMRVCELVESATAKKAEVEAPKNKAIKEAAKNKSESGDKHE